MKPDILLVEDEAYMAQIVGLVVKKTKARLHHCESMEAGLAWLDQGGQPALVLCDYYLSGGKDALSFVTKMRCRPRLEKVPVVILSGHADDKIALQAATHGVKEWVRKPFKPQELVDLINRYLTI